MLRKLLGIMSDTIHEVRKGGHLFFLINAFIGAYNRRTDVLAQGGNSQFPDLQMMAARLETIHGLVFDLNRKVDEALMGLKEDHQALTERFDKLDEATQLVADDIAALKQEIAEANERANIDLSPLVSRANDIEARLRGSAGSQAGSDPDAPTPAPEPTEPTV